MGIQKISIKLAISIMSISLNIQRLANQIAMDAIDTFSTEKSTIDKLEYQLSKLMGKLSQI
ncbi:MAG: hypothetical protein ABFD18_14980 [Syntrophomonas sp.]